MRRRLNLGDAPPDERRAARPRHLLALSGGGFRGAFTARVLSNLETSCQGLLRDRFDLIAGTSIGGLLAIATACGIPAATLDERFAAHGRKIFKPQLSSLGGLAGARYAAGPLKDACRAILGDWAPKAFADIPKAVVVVAIDELTGRPRLFRSDRLAPGEGDNCSVLDAAMATTAAPTYFPPYPLGDQVLVDGGLIANAPDLVAATDAIRRFGSRLQDLNLFSIGTAGSPRRGGADKAPGAVMWLLRHRLVDMTIEAQAQLALDQVALLGLSEIVRIDATPTSPLALDAASAKNAKELRGLADQAVAELWASRPAELARYLAYTAPTIAASAST